eukprot:TRINITY_DN50204_c0_g1_i1.p1 TRINITY_DN50204_c0_g1~~TRINITY_DN50204_c0_g1_i1.p1  ORF type:complete len:345 (-),score=49.87 TRINITY_DN50204_c0_g1_i1:129-1058(-)
MTAELAAQAEMLKLSSHGVQADSTKRSNPRWSQSKATRDNEKKVFLGKKLAQDSLGRDSPGFAYEPRRQREDPKWGFGTAAQRPPMAPKKYNETYNDLVGNIPDSQIFKYQHRSAGFGSLPRGAMSNAPDLCGFPSGRISPGPQRYIPNKASTYSVRLGHAPEIDQIPPSYTIRPKTKLMASDCQTPAKVGPGIYPVPEACCEQASSVKPSLPRWNICKRERFPESKKLPDDGRWWDGMKDQKEKNCRQYNSAPSFSFGTSTRGHQLKVARCTTKLDAGPAADMAKLHVSAPDLAPRKEILRYSGVQTF